MHHHLLRLIMLCLTLSVFHHTVESAPTRIENYPVGPDDFPSGVNPLTGLQVPNPDFLERNPVLVKISNAPPLVRPQSGIGAADLVFEHYAEGGLTRFSAIFYGQLPERVGSIRSARLIDYELMPMYQSLLAFSGASIGVEDRLNRSEFAEQLYKGVLFGWPYYWRDEDIPVPHNMFTNVAALGELAAANSANYQPDLHSMAFDPAPMVASAGNAEEIDIRYRATRVSWTYDADSGLYHRFADGRIHADANTGEQITAANIVVIYADHTFTDIIESQWQGSISYSIEIKLWFEGDAVVFRDGLYTPARWLRPTRQDMIGLRTLEDEMFYLQPGNTWFQVMPPPDQQNPAEEWLRINPE